MEKGTQSWCSETPIFLFLKIPFLSNYKSSQFLLNLLNKATYILEDFLVKSMIIIPYLFKLKINDCVCVCVSVCVCVCVCVCLCVCVCVLNTSCLGFGFFFLTCVQLTFIECLLCAQHCAECIPCIMSFTLHNNSFFFSISRITVILFSVCEVNIIIHLNNEPPCRPCQYIYFLI